MIDVHISSDVVCPNPRTLVTKTPNGDLYAVTNPVYNTIGATFYIYYSNDKGATWQLSNTITITLLWHGYSSIAADALGNVHVAWRVYSTAAPYYSYIYYFTGKHGAWNAPAVVLSELIATSPRGFVNSIAIDGSNYPHIIYLKHDTAANIRMMHLWYDGTWHSEVISSTVVSIWQGGQLIVAPDGTLHAVWRKQATSGFIYYSNKPPGGSWAAEYLTAFDATANAGWPVICCDPAGTVHFAARTEYGQRLADGTWTSLESYPATPGVVDEMRSGLAVDKLGIVRVVTPAFYLLKRTAPGNWSATLLDSTSTDNSGLVHAMFPAIEQLANGWEGVHSRVNTGDYHYIADYIEPAKGVGNFRYRMAKKMLMGL